MKLRKKTIALLLFSAAFICLISVSAFVLWRTDVLRLPNQNQPASNPVEEKLTLYPAPAADGRWGYINEQGEVVLAQVYEAALPFYGKAAWVKQGGLWGAIDAYGNLLVAPEYAAIAVYEDEPNRFICATGSNVSTAPVNSSLYDVNGQKLFGLPGELKEMTSGLMAFSRLKGEETTWGYINAHGEIAIEPIYAAAGPVSGNYALVRDTAGQTLLLNIYAQSGTPISGAVGLDAVGSRLVLVQDAASGLYGYQDVNGNLAIDHAFAAAKPFRGGAALAATASGWGLLTPEGVWAASPAYDGGEYLGHGVYAMRQPGEPCYDLLNILGDRVVSEQVFGWESWQNGLLPVHTLDKTLFVGTDAQLVDWLELPHSPGVFRLGQLFGVFDENGLSWFDDAGNTVYSVGRDRDLPGGVRLLTVLEAADVHYMVYYPQAEAAEGNLNSSWLRLNRALAENALGDQHDAYAAGDELNFAVSGSCRLLEAGGVLTAVQTLYLDDSWEEDGGREQVVQTVCFDTTTGRQYRLADLFADDVNWRTELLEPLRAACQAQTAGGPRQTELLALLERRLERDQEFSLDTAELTLYFALSDGTVQEITLAYRDIDGWLDKAGALWQNLQSEAPAAAKTGGERVGAQ